MYKATLITLMILVYHSSTSLYCQIRDLEKENINGNISSIRYSSYSMPKNSEHKNNNIAISDIIYHYNDSGNISKSYHYKHNSLFSFRKYSYKNQVEVISVIEYNKDQSVYLTIDYSSDDHGFVTLANYQRDSQKHYDNNRSSVDVEFDTYYQQLFTTVVYKNDFKGFVLEEVYYTQNKELAYKLTHKYDYKYNRVETKYYNNSGKVSWRKKMKYNLDGNMIECKYYESNRIALTSSYSYELDQYNNWVNRKEFKTLHDNFFADQLDDNTIITSRVIEYF